MSRRTDRGQATVELALSLPLLFLMLIAGVQVSVVVRDRLAVQLAAREAARAAALSPDVVAARTAAEHAVALRPLDVVVAEHGATITATVRYTEHTDVAIVGALFPDVVLTATVTMAKEPP